MNGFNPDQLVARGVFDSRQELDRVMLELDEARREPRVIACAWLEGMRFGVEISDAVERVPTRFPAACAVGAGPINRFEHRTVDAVPGRESESQRSPESDAGAASVLCPWCAIERAMNGQGAAPRTGFVSVARCARHSAEPPAPALQSLRSADAGPFHPTTNPNAGVQQAFPKGRWS